MRARLLLQILLTAAMAQAAMAEGFPGQGSAADWSDALPYYNLGNKYSSSGRWDDAAQKYREAIDRYKFDPDFWINLGVSQRNLNDYQSAEHSFKEAIKLNDKDWMPWSNLANAYLKQNRLEDCRAAFEQTLKRKPPANEVEAIKTDMFMLNKFIAQANAQKAAAQKAQSTTVGSKQTGSGAMSGAVSPKRAPASPRVQNTNSVELQGSGWDYLYK